MGLFFGPGEPARPTINGADVTDEKTYIPDERYQCPCCGVNFIDPRMPMLHKLMEAMAGQTLQITSGYRCKLHNRAVGGSRTSSHLKGLAEDIAAPDSRTRFRVISAAIRLGIHRIGIGREFIHIDIDRAKDPEVAWIY